MTATLLASKLEDVKLISVATLLEKAGHGKFSQSEFLAYEHQILNSLGFRLRTAPSLYDEVMLQYKSSLAKTLIGDLMKITLKEVGNYLSFLCHISMYSLDL
jgi:hypothetical protein